MVNRVTYHTTPLGRVMLAAKDDALAGLWMEGQKYFADTLKGEAREQDDFPVFVQAKEWLDRYFAGEKPRIAELKLEPLPDSLWRSHNLWGSGPKSGHAPQ